MEPKTNVADALRSWFDLSKNLLPLPNFSAKSFLFLSDAKRKINQTDTCNEHGFRWHRQQDGRKKRKKTYNSGYSLVVTHPTTNPPI